MFRGHFDHAMDAKGRTSLPSRFREVLAAEGDLRLVLAPDPFEACLHAYPMRAWSDLEAKIAALPQFDPVATLLRRVYVSAAHESEVDAQGRVLVHPGLRDRAILRRDVLWAGMGRTMELWARERWAAATALTEDRATELRRALSEQLRI